MGISCSICSYVNMDEAMTHMSGGLDWREKICAQKLDHSMLVQPILCRKMEKSKFFNEPFFRNRPISIFPYVKLEEKWRKNGSLRAVNCLNLFRNALNSLLNKHWHRPKTLRIQSCSFQCKYVSKIWFSYNFLLLNSKMTIMTTFALKLMFCMHICIELNNFGFLKPLAHVNVCSRVS